MLSIPQYLDFSPNGKTNEICDFFLELLRRKSERLYLHSQQVANYSASVAAKLGLSRTEIGMIRNLNIFDKATVALINAELDIRYFTPVIKKITSAKEKFGYNYWEADTSAGKVSIVLNNPFSNIRVLEDGRIYIFDMDGNCFLIPDPTKLDRLTYRTIEIYL